MKMRAASKTTTATKEYSYLQRQPDSKGNVRLYWRHPHLAKPVKCDGTYGSREFIAQYEQLNAELAAWRNDRVAQAAAAAAKVAKPINYLPGTIGSVIDRYEASPKFASRRPGTQDVYRCALRLMKRQIGGITLTHLNERNVAAYLDKISTNHGPARANQQQVLMSVLWKFSKRLPECKHTGKVNPACEVEREYKPKKPHRPWPEDIQERFLDGAPRHLRHAFYLLLYTGQRRSDVVRMKKSHFDPKTRRLMVEAQVKTGVRVPLRVHKKLMPALAEMLQSDREHLLLNANGEAYAGYGAGLTQAFRQRLQEVGVPARQYTLHGLRKSAACMVAQCPGIELHVLMEIFGWKNPQMALHYIRDANKEVLIDRGFDLWEQADERKLRLVKSA